MIQGALVVLGIGAVVVGLAPIAHAQSGEMSISTDSSVTLSGESLRTIESRTVSGDYRTFFNGAATDGQTGSATNVGRLTDTPKRSPFSDVVGEDVDITIGDTLNPQSPTAFPPSGEVGDRQRVRVQLDLGE